MSMASNVGSEIAFKDVLKKIEELRKDDHKFTPEEILDEISDFCEANIKHCESGWY